MARLEHAHDIRGLDDDLASETDENAARDPLDPGKSVTAGS
jgi:hypothetical protein